MRVLAKPVPVGFENNGNVIRARAAIEQHFARYLGKRRSDREKTYDALNDALLGDYGPMERLFAQFDAEDAKRDVGSKHEDRKHLSSMFRNYHITISTTQ